MQDNREHMLLDDFIREKIERIALNPFLNSPFGYETDGQFLNKWLSNYERISFFTRSFGMSDFSSQSLIDVYVPATSTGIVPVNVEEQPYHWSGKINGAAAEAAVWHAFELFPGADAVNFMGMNSPVVVFKYIEKSRRHALTVQFADKAWRVVDLDD